MSCVTLRTKLSLLTGLVSAFISQTSFAAFVMIAPGGPSGLSAETAYCVLDPVTCPLAGPPLLAGPGPFPVLFPPPPGNPPALPGTYIVDALSSGVDAGTIYHFSVDLAAVGAPASAVAFEVAVGTAPSQIFPGPPLAVGVPPEAAGDIFTVPAGPVFGVPILAPPVVGGPADEFLVGLNVGDNLGGLTFRTAIGGAGTMLYSLAAGGLGAGPFLPGDIVNGGTAALYAAAAVLGLDTGTLVAPCAAGSDDLDALIVHDIGAVPGVYDPGDAVAFSLAPGSCTLPLIGATPGDVLVPLPAGLPAIFMPFAAFGLAAGDNLDALDVTLVPVPAGLPLLVSALAALGWMRRRKV